MQTLCCKNSSKLNTRKLEQSACKFCTQSCMYFLVYSCVDFFTRVFRVFLVELVCNMEDFHAENTRVMLQCPQHVLYQRAVVNGSTFSCTSTARSKLKNSHTCTVQNQDVKEQLIQFREIKGFSVLGRYHFAVVTKQDQTESLLSKITSSKLLNNICNIQ